MDWYEPGTGRAMWEIEGLSKEEFFCRMNQGMQSLMRDLTEAQASFLADALRGDDRPAANGDEFAAEMARLMGL